MKLVSVAAVVAVVAAGCGGAARQERSALHGVPPALAHDWERQASAIAAAASTGDDCHAMQLANSLRAQVIASEHKLPLRLRSPLVTGVNALADRLTCPATTVTTGPKKEPKKHDHHDDHGHHGHGGGNDK